MIKRKNLVSIILVIAVMLTMVSFGNFKKTKIFADEENLSDNLFICDDFAEYASNNSLSLPFSLTDPATGGIGNIGGGNGGDNTPQIKNDGTDTYLEFNSQNGKLFTSFFAFWNSADTNSVENGKLVLGKYKVTFVVRENGTAFDTDNWGGRLYGSGSEDFALILGENNNLDSIEADANGWKTYSLYIDVSQATCDSISMWFNSKNLSYEISSAQIKSIKVQRVIPMLGVVGSCFEFNKGTPTDLTFNIDFAGNTFTSLSYLGDNLASGKDYTLNNNILVLKKDFLNTLLEGTQNIELVAGNKSTIIKIEVIPLQPSIPNKDDYVIKNSTVNGDFDGFSEGLIFSSTQQEGAWGSLDSYDYPATIVKKDGSNALSLKKATGNKSYSSAFVMLPPEWEVGDVITLKFDYLYISGGSNINDIVNVCFVGATNTTNHEILLNNSNPSKTQGGNRFLWDITYTSLSGERNNWQTVEMTFIVDTQLKAQCDSLRFLLNVDNDNSNDEIYFDNVGIYTWTNKSDIDFTPVITKTSYDFSKKDMKDIVVTVDTFEYAISSLKNNTTILTTDNYSVSEDNSSITLKKEYLESLKNGVYTFTISTEGGNATFTVEISGSSSGCGSNIEIVTISSLAIISMLISVIVIEKKKKN